MVPFAVVIMEDSWNFHKVEEARIAKITLETHMSLFPHWSLERIQKEVIDDLSIHRLESSVSFELNNTADSQLDFPLTLKAFLFQGFSNIKKAPLSDYDVNNMLFSFYLKHGQPQIKTWDSEEYVAMKRTSHLLIFHA